MDGLSNIFTIHCRWEDHKARKRTGHPPLYNKAKKHDAANTKYSWLCLSTA